jgi:hypothetical protein
MLSEDSTRISQKIAEVVRLRTESHRLAEYQRRAEKMTAAKTCLEPVATSALACRDSGISLPAVHPKVETLRKLLSEASCAAKSDFEQLLTGRFNFAQIERDANDVAVWTAEQLRNVWREHAARIAPAVNPEVLNLLERMPAFSLQIKVVRVGLARFHSLASSLPTRPSQVSDLQSAALEVHEAFLQLHTDDIPTVVWTFLKQATSPVGADLSALTAEVIEWLGVHGLESAFTIKQRI